MWSAVLVLFGGSRLVACPRSCGATSASSSIRLKKIDVPTGSRERSKCEETASAQRKQIEALLTLQPGFWRLRRSLCVLYGRYGCPWSPASALEQEEKRKRASNVPASSECQLVGGGGVAKLPGRSTFGRYGCARRAGIDVRMREKQEQHQKLDANAKSLASCCPLSSSSAGSLFNSRDCASIFRTPPISAQPRPVRSVGEAAALNDTGENGTCLFAVLYPRCRHWSQPPNYLSAT